MTEAERFTGLPDRIKHGLNFNVSCSKAKKKRSRSLLQASRIACVSVAVRIRGSFAGAFSEMALPRYGFPLLT